MKTLKDKLENIDCLNWNVECTCRGEVFDDVKESVLKFNEFCNGLKQKAHKSSEAKGNIFIVMMIQQEFNKTFGDFENDE